MANHSDKSWEKDFYNKGTLFQEAKPTESSYIEGQTWYRTSDGVMFVLYVDANTSQWVSMNGGNGAPGTGVGDLLANGTIPLTANWDVGAFKITALSFESDVATGTAPLIVASTTLVTNLNAEALNGNAASAFESADATIVKDADFAAQGYMKRDASAGSYSVQAIPVPVTDTAAKCTNALADQTSVNETSHSDVIVDGDFSANGLLERTAAGVYTVDTNTYLTETQVDARVTAVETSHTGLITSTGVTYENLSTNSDIGTGAAQVAQGDHTHSVEYMVPIWAEENATLANSTYEWAFGNGADTPTNGGIAIYIPSGYSAQIVAMSAVTNTASGSSVIEAEINGTLQGTNCNVTLAGRSATNDSFTAVALSDADRLNFRTTTAGTSAQPCTVTAWIRYYK